MKKLFAYILLIGGLAALGSGIWLGVNKYLDEKNIEAKAEEALVKLQEMIPERSKGSVYNDGKDSDMPILEINGFPFVGYIEIPEAEVIFPVQNQWGDPLISKMRGGNITYGTGVIETDQIAFDSITEGMTVSFTDINGTVYDFFIDYIGEENDIVNNAKLILFDEGMSKVIQIACIEKQ